MKNDSPHFASDKLFEDLLYSYVALGLGALFSQHGLVEIVFKGLAIKSASCVSAGVMLIRLGLNKRRSAFEEFKSQKSNDLPEES